MIIKGIAPTFSALKTKSPDPASPSHQSQKVTAFSTQVSIATQVDPSSVVDTEPSRNGYEIKDGSSVVGIKSHLLGSFKIPDYLTEEMELRAKEESIREAINFQYSNEHQYKTVGQVYVDGKFYAEVDSGGGYGSIRTIPGLSQEDMSPQERMKEIASVLQSKGRVEVRHTDFGPGLGGWRGPAAPAQMLPAYTARSMHEIHQEIQNLFEIQKNEYLASQPMDTSTNNPKA